MDDAETPADDQPPVTPIGAELESIIESLLFAADRPLGVGDLKRLLGERQSRRIEDAVAALAARCAGTGVVVVAAAGGWQLRTNPDNAAWVARLLAGRPPRLSRAMLETLAIVAYRQPVTRPQIDEVRRVDSGPVLGTLLERGLIRVLGKAEEVGRPLLYGTTPQFLRTFSLNELQDLPTLREFHELDAEGRARFEAETGAAPEAAEDGAAAPASGGASAPQPWPAPPGPGAQREVDDDEDDSLVEELDRAGRAAEGAAGGLAAEPAERDPQA